MNYNYLEKKIIYYSIAYRTTPISMIANMVAFLAIKEPRKSITFKPKKMSMQIMQIVIKVVIVVKFNMLL